MVSGSGDSKHLIPPENFAINSSIARGSVMYPSRPTTIEVDKGVDLSASNASSRETPPRLANAIAVRTLEYAASVTSWESAAYITLPFEGDCKSNSVCKVGTAFE